VRFPELFQKLRFQHGVERGGVGTKVGVINVGYKYIYIIYIYYIYIKYIHIVLSSGVRGSEHFFFFLTPPPTSPPTINPPLTAGYGKRT
jgi:hypothetical protein